MSLACVANISVGFQSKKSQKNGIFEVLAVRKMGREQKMREGGRGRGREEMLADKVQDFEHRPRCLICLRDLMLS